MPTDFLRLSTLRIDADKDWRGKAINTPGNVDGVDISVHAADLDAHTYNWMSKIRTGELFRPYPIFDSGLVALAADRICAMPFYVARNLTIDRLAIEVTSGDAGKIARLGVYKDGTNIYPGALVKDYGTVSVTNIAVVLASATQALTKGLHWLVVVSDGTPTLVWLAPTWSPIGMLAEGLVEGYTWAYWYKDAVGSGALADPFVSGASKGTIYAPGIVPRLLTLD